MEDREALYILVEPRTVDASLGYAKQATSTQRRRTTGWTIVPHGCAEPCQQYQARTRRVLSSAQIAFDARSCSEGNRTQTRDALLPDVALWSVVCRSRYRAI